MSEFHESLENIDEHKVETQELLEKNPELAKLLEDSEKDPEATRQELKDKLNELSATDLKELENYYAVLLFKLEGFNRMNPDQEIKKEMKSMEASLKVIREVAEEKRKNFEQRRQKDLRDSKDGQTNDAIEIDRLRKKLNNL